MTISSAQSQVDNSVFNQRATLSHLGGDPQLLKELATMFVEQESEMSEAAKSAIAARNSESLRHTIHQLESSLSTFFPERSMMALSDVRAAGKNSDWIGVEVHFARFAHEVGLLLEVLRKLEMPNEANS